MPVYSSGSCMRNREFSHIHEPFMHAPFTGSTCQRECLKTRPAGQRFQGCSHVMVAACTLPSHPLASAPCSCTAWDSHASVLSRTPYISPNYTVGPASSPLGTYSTVVQRIFGAHKISVQYQYTWIPDKRTKQTHQLHSTATITSGPTVHSSAAESRTLAATWVFHQDA